MLLYILPTIINTNVCNFQAMTYNTGEYQECYRDFLCLILLSPPPSCFVPFSTATVAKLVCVVNVHEEPKERVKVFYAPVMLF